MDLSSVDYSYTAVLVAGLLPYIFAGLAKFGASEPYNNNDPRAFLEKVEGKQRRANNAQLNSFEAFPLFAVGVLVAHQKMGAAPADYTTLNALALGFVLARVVYGWAYISDLASLRSLVWFGGLACACALYFQ
jgi:uncharacterized MAPEG superfamily protein